MEIPFGHIADGILYRDAAGDFKQLELKAVSDDDAVSVVAQYVASFEKLLNKFSEVENKINTSNNKGSFLSSLLNIKDQLPTHAGLGDYVSLQEKIDLNVNLLEDYVAQNRQKNTDIKTALLLELDAILENNDIDEAFEQIKGLKSRWIKTGSPGEEVKEELESKFKAGMDAFFEKRNAFDEDKKDLLNARVVEYKAIIAKIEGFIKAKDFSSSLSVVKSLQSEWKEIGRVPEAEFKALNDQYWELCQQYFDQKRSVQKEQSKNKSKSKKESLAQRQKVIKQMEEVLHESLRADQVAKVKQLGQEWKKCGPLSRKDNSEIHDQYLKLSRAIQERQFVLQLTKKKVKDFKSKEDKDKLYALQKVIRDLLRRDETELSSFQENLEKMHINKGSFVDMLEAKLQTQQDKVTTKREILKEIQEKIKEA
ncbi:DUF349 domain-containing protein [Reichenbachiella sp. MSK19-1]|uniref:DUF349 domain-containing protein n=1 Tax=Reichenbachiella sp. MSK19-1 TaxID=1897631 RepID=UPI000E6B9D9F|nr:DUF349 domain-containing protein [Reichenbachiella sp. MSK19-1]RJE74297.1 hypothetical protein BGP76_14065 [Reichenbachiella sp. MSK19-1]